MVVISVVISIVIAVFVATVVVVPVAHFVAVSVRLVAITVSISIPSYLSAAVDPTVIRVMVISPAVVCISPAVIRVMVISPAVVCISPAVIRVVVVSPPVVSVMIVPNAVAEARVITESRLILASPFPVFPLALTAEPVVLDIFVAAFSQPFPVVRIVPVIAAVAAVIRIVGAVAVFRTASGQHRPHCQCWNQKSRESAHKCPFLLFPLLRLPC
jgi:hypothetical protein